MYASSNPRDIVPGEWEDEPITFIQNQINYVLTDYEETYSILKDLYYYKEYLEEKLSEEITTGYVTVIA